MLVSQMLSCPQQHTFPASFVHTGIPIKATPDSTTSRNHHSILQPHWKGVSGWYLYWGVTFESVSLGHKAQLSNIKGQLFYSVTIVD